jgi:hypothetical protein
MFQEQAAYTMENVVADVVGVVEALGHDRMTLVVHDWGGLIGWCAAHGLHLHRTQLLSCLAVSWRRNGQLLILQSFGCKGLRVECCAIAVACCAASAD